jgi:hypothetical protein
MNLCVTCREDLPVSPTSTRTVSESTRISSPPNISMVVGAFPSPRWRISDGSRTALGGGPTLGDFARRASRRLYSPLRIDRMRLRRTEEGCLTQRELLSDLSRSRQGVADPE